MANPNNFVHTKAEKAKNAHNPWVKRYNSAHIYLDTLEFLTYFKENCLKNMSKDDKVCFGYDYTKNLVGVILCFKDAFTTKDDNIKIKHLHKIREILQTVEIETNVMYSAKAIAKKQSANCHKFAGGVETQVIAWIAKLSEEKQ